MATVRRAYVFLLSAVGLSMLLGGLVGLGVTLIDVVAGSGPFVRIRDNLASNAAFALAGLIGWLLHWRAAQRQAGRDSAERAATLRRFYGYAALTALTVASALAGTALLERFLALMDQGRFDGVGVATDAWRLLLFGLAWLYHLRVSEDDRAATGEIGGAATVRRWYAYGIQLVALVIVLFATRDLLLSLIETPGSLGRPIVSELCGRGLVWLGVWLWHLRWTTTADLAREDRDSTLRAVEAFLIVGLAVALVLVEGHRILYYGLAKLLGVEAPGGVRTLDLVTLARPFSTVVVFGAGWAFTRDRLRLDAAEAEPSRQHAVHRLYQHLVALVAVIALALGLTDLIWNVLDLLLSAKLQAAPYAVDQISFFLTLVIVALPVWLSYWRAARPPEERAALSRRLYLSAVLALCAIAILADSAVTFSIILNAFLAADFSALPARLSSPLSVLTVAVLFGFYHWRVLQIDARERAGLASSTPDQEPSTLLTLLVEIRGAEEESVRQALAALPTEASYSIRRR